MQCHHALCNSSMCDAMPQGKCCCLIQDCPMQCRQLSNPHSYQMSTALLSNCGNQKYTPPQRVLSLLEKAVLPPLRNVSSTIHWRHTCPLTPTPLHTTCSSVEATEASNRRPFIPVQTDLSLLSCPCVHPLLPVSTPPLLFALPHLSYTHTP